MKQREEVYSLPSYTPSIEGCSKLFPGTYFLEKVDERSRRMYNRVEGTFEKVYTEKLSCKSKLANGSVTNGIVSESVPCLNGRV